MKIENANKRQRAWADREACPDLEEPVEFNEKGVATVSAEVGRAMIAAYPETFSEVQVKARKQ